MSMNTAQIDASIRRLRRNLARLRLARHDAEIREAQHASILRAFDAGNTNCERLAAEFGQTHAAVRSIIYRNGRSVIITRQETRNRRLRDIADRHAREGAV